MLSMRCAVPACSNDRTRNSDKTFLRAPEQKSLRDEWFRVLGVPDSVEDAFFCEDHFQVDDKSEGGYESAASVSASDSEAGAETEPANLKRKSVIESKLPFKKKMLSEHRNSNQEFAPDEVVQACFSNQSSSPSSPVSVVSQEHSDNSESTWSVREGPIIVNDDSNGSGELVIKSEPEDDGYEETERNGGHDYIVPKALFQGGIKIEASPMELHEEKSKLLPVGHDRINDYQLPVLSHPFLEIVDQPETSYRFRYKRESSKPHGPLKGRSSVSKPPKHSHGPTVMSPDTPDCQNNYVMSRMQPSCAPVCRISPHATNEQQSSKSPKSSGAESSWANKEAQKEQPTSSSLRNFHGREAVIRVWLFCGEQVSPHQLVAPPDSGKSELKYEPHEVRVTSQNDFTASFDKLNILHVVCGERDYQKRYYEKKVFCMSQSYYPPAIQAPINFTAVKDEVKRIEKDIVRLYCQAFEKTERGFRKICEVYSDDIKNKKSPKTNDLKILRQSHEEGSCRGNQQILIFTEKLIKDVNVEFFEEDEDGEITWRSKASFKEADIHKQVAINFWTPPYKDLHIKTPVPVFFRLVRKTDGAYSHNRTYRYMPADCPCKLPRKAQPKVPSDVYLKWPRRRECTSPDKMTYVKDAGVQASLAGFDEMNSVKRCGPLKPVYMLNKNQQPNSYVHQQLNLNHKPHSYVHQQPNSNHQPAANQQPNRNVANMVPNPQLLPNSSVKNIDRKHIQLPGNFIQQAGHKFLKVHLPAFVFKGMPTPPEPSSTPPPLTAIPHHTQPEPEKP